MMQKLLFILFSYFLPIYLSAQQESFIEGKIREQTSGENIPFARVSNKTLLKNILSNEDGYFRIPVQDLQDSILVDVIGFRKYWLKIDSLNAFYDVLLEENAQLLSEITVKPGDNSMLYKLLEDCRKKQSSKHETSKVYYELKSFVENKQVELVENFYNGSIYGYELDELALKTGRIALRDFDKTFFGSMESSRAIIMFKLFKDNDYFPTSPFELKEKKLKEQFHLRLQRKYLDDRKDSVYVLDFIPRDKSGTHFTGSIWINLRTKGILKTELHCEHAVRHPFLPLFPSDTIQNLDLHIASSFEESGGKMLFRHIDFSYETTYKNRSNTTYKAFTQAILYAYDFGNTFVLPEFNFAAVSDFKQISAVPYNTYFWKNHNELKTSDQQGQNEKFYNHPLSVTNRSIYSQGKFDRGIYESPYLTWNGKRIRVREFSVDPSEQTVDPRGGVIISELYNLSASIYMDINQYKDSLQVITTTVFDPYKSYYRLELDNAALYFINVYFDLIEIERRKLESNILQSDRKLETIQKLYAESEDRLSALQTKYLKEVDHGQNEREMEKWNKMVVDALKIDNLDLFRPYVK